MSLVIEKPLRKRRNELVEARVRRYVAQEKQKLSVVENYQ